MKQRHISTPVTLSMQGIQELKSKAEQLQETVARAISLADDLARIGKELKVVVDFEPEHKSSGTSGACNAPGDS